MGGGAIPGTGLIGVVASLVGVAEETVRDTGYGPPSPVPIFQRRWEFEQLQDIYRHRRPRNVLEVGSYYGGTLYWWLTLAQPGAMIVSVDTYGIPEGDNRWRYPNWVRKDVQLELVVGDSTDPKTVELTRQLGPYDWVFIDADHHEGPVRSDWMNYGQMVTPGAVVAFHDILTHPAHPEIEVERVWRDIQRQGYVTQELVADQDAEWGGIGVVYL